jgi:hypothetical protein
VRYADGITPLMAATNLGDVKTTCAYADVDPKVATPQKSRACARCRLGRR